MFQARQRYTIHCQWLILVVILALLFDSEFHEYQFLHVADAVEGQTELLLPHRVESIVLDNPGTIRNSTRRRGARRSGFSGRKVFRTSRLCLLRKEWGMGPVGDV